MAPNVGAIRDALGTARRVGAFDPGRTLSLGLAMAAWGPTTATAYSSSALRHPRRTALVDDYGRLTYLQLDLRTSRVAAGLRHLGVDSGQRVGILCRNHRGFVEANIALAKLGTRVVYLNPGLPTSQLLTVIEREELSAVIVDRDLIGRLDDLSNDVLRVVTAPEDEDAWSFPRLSRWRPLIQLPRPLAQDDPIVLTSGTTGAPKGTVRRPGASALSATFGLLGAVPYERGDVMVLPAPLFHAWGLSQLILAATLGQTVVLRRTFDAETVLNDVEAHGADILIAVPVMLHRMLNTNHEADLSSLRITASSGSALPGDLATRWISTYGPNLYSLYGSTEVGQVSVATPAHLIADPASGGEALKGIDVRIVDEDGASVEVGQIGRIVVNSSMHFEGYTDGGNKEMIDEFMSIGDLGWLDADGVLHVAGRADDMIISGGENIYPNNIERALGGCADVDEAVVVGVPDPDLGQMVRAVVVINPLVEASSMTARLKKALRTELASHEIPRQFVYVDELPRNAAGKVLRRQLTGAIDGVGPATSAAAKAAPSRSRSNRKKSK